MIISSTNIDNNSFSGRFKIKNPKKMPQDVLKTLNEAPFLKRMTSDHDVAIRVIKQKRNFFDTTHKDEYLYNLSFSVLRENSLIDRALDFMHLKRRKTIAHNLHEAKGIVKRLNDTNYTTKLEKKFFDTI